MGYQLNPINETSFGLEKVTPINNNNSSLGNESTNHHSNSEDSKTKLSRIKNLFEFNYELKFTNKDSK